MATIVTRDQFDAALTDAVTKIETAIADLKAKVDAGQVAPEDFSAELAEIQGLVSVAATADPTPAAPAAPASPAATPTS